MPVRAWLAVGALLDAGERPLTRAPMVGRERELQVLSGIWERVSAERRPHLVTLFGPAGIGKSRLALEFAQLVASRGGRVMRGRSTPADCGRVRQRPPRARRLSHSDGACADRDGRRHGRAASDGARGRDCGRSRTTTPIRCLASCPRSAAASEAPRRTSRRSAPTPPCRRAARGRRTSDGRRAHADDRTPRMPRGRPTRLEASASRRAVPGHARRVADLVVLCQGLEFQGVAGEL